jgi:hypothetical protein
MLRHGHWKISTRSSLLGKTEKNRKIFTKNKKGATLIQIVSGQGESFKDERPIRQKKGCAYNDVWKAPCTLKKQVPEWTSMRDKTIRFMG